MEFKKAYELMKKGAKIKLPSWGGYWYWNDEKETIMMHTKDNDEIDLFDSNRKSYTLQNIASSDFVVADEGNTPALGGIMLFGFDEAIKYLKRGMRVSRKGWNGKKQYIELATNISYKNANDKCINVEHNDIGNKAIAFVGTSGVQLGWLASQADMLAEDWTFAEQGDK